MESDQILTAPAERHSLAKPVPATGRLSKKGGAMPPRQVDPDQPSIPRSAPMRDHHAHHASLSRRRFLGGAAGAVGAALGASALDPTRAFAAKPTDPTPRPIPGGFDVGGQVFHVFGFGPGQEPASITDFNGFTGVTDVQGTGTATYPDG